MNSAVKTDSALSVCRPLANESLRSCRPVMKSENGIKRSDSQKVLY